MPRNSRLILAHLWVAFAAFGAAIILGLWQMWVRSPFAAPLASSENYFMSVTAHGSAMGYVLTTFFIMGFGYFVAETALSRPVPHPRFAWAGFLLGIVGTVLVVVTVLSGRATVLFTFYPPLTATPWFYIGLVMVVIGSWIWCALMLVAMAAWKRENPGQAVPLAMFATTANAVLWLWTTVGVAAELLFIVIPAAFGWTQTLDVGLTRTLFSWTLHAIVYFWLIPAYIAFYTLVLATGLSFFMLWFGGFGGLINMSYGMNAMVHNTSWVTAHFHMIFGGSVVIMYFAISYEIWPRLTGRGAPSLGLQRVQLWSWAVGMMTLSLPWHLLGLKGQWRRVAQFDYTDPAISWWTPWMAISLAGGAILVASAFLFLWNLTAFHRIPRTAAAPKPIGFAVALHPGGTPAALNGFRLWNVLVLVLMVAAYAYPIIQSFIVKPPYAVVHRVDRTN